MDRVAALLGSTCTGFTVPFGGDGTSSSILVPEVGATAEINTKTSSVEVGDITSHEDDADHEYQDATLSDHVYETPHGIILPSLCT